jgi:hypothetical protein
MRHAIAGLATLALIAGVWLVRDEDDGQDLDARTGMVAFGPDVTDAEGQDADLNDQSGIPSTPVSLPDVESVVLEGIDLPTFGVPMGGVPMEFVLWHYLGNSTRSAYPLMWETRGGDGMEPWQMTVLFGEISEGSNFLDGDTQILEMSFVFPLEDPSIAPPPFRQELFLPIPFDPLGVKHVGGEQSK